MRKAAAAAAGGGGQRIATVSAVAAHGRSGGGGALLRREDVAERVDGTEEQAVAHRVCDDVQPCHARREQTFNEDHEVALHSRVVGGVDSSHKRGSTQTCTRGKCTASRGLARTPHVQVLYKPPSDRPTAAVLT